MIHTVVILALGATFIILLITKLGWREKAQVHGPEFISDMFNCDFCLSFWVGLMLAIILFLFMNGEWDVLLCPVLSSPITRKLL